MNKTTSFENSDVLPDDDNLWDGEISNEELHEAMRNCTPIDELTKVPKELHEAIGGVIRIIMDQK